MASIGMAESGEGKNHTAHFRFWQEIDACRGASWPDVDPAIHAASAPLSDRTQVKCNVINPLNCLRQRSRGGLGQARP
jgi:hypothetical protein